MNNNYDAFRKLGVSAKEAGEALALMIKQLKQAEKNGRTTKPHYKNKYIKRQTLKSKW